MAKPPYQQIADEIRQRIESGELLPGARVPSARQITAKWGVAIATATKALAALQQDGVVEAVPGVGTIVATASKLSALSKGLAARQQGRVAKAVPGAGTAVAMPGGISAALPNGIAAGRAPGVLSKVEAVPEGLTRDKIVAMAVEIADTEGLVALSMRRIATELGVATMSLYRYVRGKDELLLHMIDAVFGDTPLPKRPEGWRNQMDTAARHTWAMFRRHRWLAPVMSLTRPQLAPNALAHTDWVLTGLEGLGLDNEAKIHIHVMLFSYVRGIATSLEAEAEAEQDTGLTNDEWMETQQATITALAHSGSYPAVVQLMLETELDLDLDSLFEFGLLRLLDGLSVLIASQQSAAKGGRSRRAGSTR